ncbi:MAG: serine/threonine-protein kinase [Myxococcales bacterium]
MTEVPIRPSQQPEPDDWLGRVVSGKYRVVRLIGRGGMGRVYEVENIRIGRMMALKRIAPELTTNPEIVRRFELEARAAGRLLHENILAVTDFDRAEDGTPYLVMELLDGGSLTKVLKTVPFLDSQRATDLVVQACRGLAVAHAAGIVHRDLKPGNLFVCKRADGTELVKVLDFGIAKLKGEYADFGDETRPGCQLGTLKYMSPEQARGDAGVDARTDVYALGVILYQALSNKLPHLGADDVQIAVHRQKYEPIPLSQHRPDLSAQLCAVVERALAKNPEDRIPSVQALEQALLAAVRLPGASAADDGATQPPIEEPPDEPERARPSHSLEPVGTESRVPVQGARATRSRAIEFTAAVAFLGTLVAVASWRFFEHGSSSNSPTVAEPRMNRAATSSLGSAERGESVRASSSDDSGDHDVPNLADSDVHDVRNHDEPAQSSAQDGAPIGDRTPRLPGPRPSTVSNHGPLAASLPAPVKKAEVSTRTSHGQGGGHGKAEPVESSRDSSGTAKDNSKVLRSDHWGDNPYTGGTKGALPRTEQR